MRLSKKKESELYRLLSEEIMTARIKIWKLRNDVNISISEIDDIMSDLMKDAPQKAINLFNEPKNEQS